MIGSVNQAEALPGVTCCRAFVKFNGSYLTCRQHPAGHLKADIQTCWFLQVVVHGLPIRPAFSHRFPSQRRLRKHLGMDRDLPAVMLVGGTFPSLHQKTVCLNSCNAAVCTAELRAGMHDHFNCARASCIGKPSQLACPQAVAVSG